MFLRVLCVLLLVGLSTCDILQSECAGGYCDAKQVGKSEFRVLKPKIKPAPLQQKMFYRARGHNNADLVDQLKRML